MQNETSFTWRLEKLLQDWVEVHTNHTETTIRGLSLDSRSTREGDLFFALRGLQQHGLEYAPQAVVNGAAAIAWETNSEINKNDLPSQVPCIGIEDLQSKLGFICQHFYRNPTQHMKVIAVTGTDGKTSVSQFIAQAFHQLNLQCGVVGTLGYGIYPRFDDASHTTPDAVRMHGLLNDFYTSNIKHTVLEASSHGLQQGRLNGVEIDTGVFTNLGRDHMDYHASMQDYFDAKRLLFQNTNLKNAVINIDDEAGLRLAKEFSEKLNVITYSIHDNRLASNAFINATNINSKSGLTTFDIDSSYGTTTSQTKLVGKFNISNLLAVLGSLLSSEVEFDRAAYVLGSLQTVSGRMEFIQQADSTNNKLPAVVIDYAHTPQALINVLKVLQQQCNGKLWCVFGCGGNRDQGKRKLMAQAVEEFADVAVITDDNPRFEDPQAITDEIKAGFTTTSKHFLVHDRREAIEYAIQHADQDDIVLIAGKGHETVQIVKNQCLPFDDKQIANDTLLAIAQ